MSNFDDDCFFEKINPKSSTPTNFRMVWRHFVLNYDVIQNSQFWAEVEKTTENGNILYFVCDVINDVSLISYTLSESPWSEICYTRLTKCGDYVVALKSQMHENLKMALERHLVNQYRWHIPQKVGNFSRILNMYISWPSKGHQRSNLGQIVYLWSNRA